MASRRKEHYKIILTPILIPNEMRSMFASCARTASAKVTSRSTDSESAKIIPTLRAVGLSPFCDVNIEVRSRLRAAPVLVY